MTDRTATRVFQGGRLKLTAAQSPADLTSRPISHVFADDVDTYPMTLRAEAAISAGEDARAVVLAALRMKESVNG